MAVFAGHLKATRSRRTVNTGSKANKESMSIPPNRMECLRFQAGPSVTACLGNEWGVLGHIPPPSFLSIVNQIFNNRFILNLIHPPRHKKDAKGTNCRTEAVFPPAGLEGKSGGMIFLLTRSNLRYRIMDVTT